MEESGTNEKAAAEEPIPPPGLRQDLLVLMKVRLNFFVLITTFFGFLLYCRGVEMNWMKLLHTILGTAAAAFGSAAFNQLMEVDLDARMKRTADRPLPSRRMDPLVAFGIGWVLSAVGIIHLALQVGHLAAYLTAATVAIYVFIYTPLKRVSSTNTLVGAIPGAVPPVIGWVGAGGSIGWEAPAFHRHQLAVSRGIRVRGLQAVVQPRSDRTEERPALRDVLAGACSVFAAASFAGFR